MVDTILRQQETASTIRLYMSAGVIALPCIAAGAGFGYPAVALPFYTNPTSNLPIHLSQQQATWFVSLSAPMQLVGNLLVGVIMERIGRKKTILISSLLLVIAFFIITSAPTYEILLIGCFLNGTSVGMIMPACILLLSEISLIRLRGVMGSFPLVVMNIGYSLSIVLGSLIDMNYFSSAIATPIIVFLILYFYLAESPVWLMQQSSVDEANKALVALRGKTYSPQGELKEIEDLMSEGNNEDPTASWTSRAFLLPLTILSALFFFHASFGADVISTYAMTIFKFPGIPLSPAVMALLFQLGWTFAFIIASALMSRIGRRKQFMGGCLGMASSLMILGCFHFFNMLAADQPLITWAAVVLHIIFIVAFGVGCGPIPHALTGELFPQQLKSFGCGIAIAVRFLAQFLQLRLYHPLKAAVGMSGVYGINSITALVACIFVFFLLPETRNMSISQLNLVFKKQHKADSEEGGDYHKNIKSVELKK